MLLKLDSPRIMWSELLLAFGGTALLIAALAWLARSIVLHVLSKDLEKFKHSLQMEAAQFKTTWDLLHAKRAELIAELYGKLVDFNEAAKSFTSVAEYSDEPNKEKKYALYQQKASEFHTCFVRNRIYFTERTCHKIDDLFKKIEGASQGFNFWSAQGKHAAAERKADEAWSKAWKTVTEEAPPLMASMEEDFRTLLGVSNPPQDMETLGKADE